MSRRQSQSSSGSGFAVFLVLGAIAWVVSFIIRHIWVILGILVVIGSIYLAKAIAQDNRRRREAYDRYGAELVAKAEQQDAWLAAGDERGIYGPGAVELMRYIKSGGKTPPPTQASASAVFVPQPLSRARQAAVPAVVAGGVGIALMLTQVGGPGSDSTPSRSTSTRTTAPSATRTPYLPPPRPTETPTWSSAAPASPTAQRSAAANAPAEIWIMPNEIGKTLQRAQDDIQAVTGSPMFGSKSADLTGKGRHQVFDRNWRVCSSSPPPGVAFTAQTDVVFGVVKESEICP